MADRFRRRLTDIRDRLNVQFNRVLNEDTPEEGGSLQQRFEMFRQEAGGGPVRRPRRGTGRPRMITFRVSVLRSSSVERYRSSSDGTRPQRVVVPLDLDSAGFVQLLREQIPDLPEAFDLCKVNGQRWVAPLNETTPGAIHRSNALGRSALYIRPKAPETEMQAGSGLATTLGTLDEGDIQPAVVQRSELQSGTRPGPVAPVVQSSEVPSGSLPEPGPVVQRDDFYVDLDDGSDEEEVHLLPSSAVDSTNDEKSLIEVLEEFRKNNVDEHQNSVIIARRRKILHCACVALSRPYFSWYKVPQIEFVSEMADDYGGPRREFFRLLMLEMQNSMGVFEGKAGDLVFSYDQQAFSQQKYFTAGRLTAWAISHNGPGICSLNRELYALMCGQSAALENYDIEQFLDEELRANICKVDSCTTQDDLCLLKATTGDWISGCGVPSIYSATLGDLPKIRSQIVAHYLFHRVASMIHQFMEGMNSCGRFWDMVKHHWLQFQPLFVATKKKLTRTRIQSLFQIEWSLAGSNQREEEEETIFNWQLWLMEIQEGGTDITFEDLLVFVTGADQIPPLGFPHECSLNFYNQEPGERRLPFASTCSLMLSLPRGVGDEGEFRALMDTALKGSLGFGKV